MLLKRKTFWSQIKNILKPLSVILCFVIVIAVVVLLSTNTYDAITLRKPRSVVNDYVSIPKTFNASVYQKFLTDLKSNSSTNNKTTIVQSRFVTLHGLTSKRKKVKEKKCKPEPPIEDFSRCGNRVADRKCCEYIAAWKYKDDLMERAECTRGFGIVGGSRARPGEFPHMAALGFKLKNKMEYHYKCGGSLISDQFVLTAGHCTRLANTYTNYELEPKIVGLGSEHLLQNITQFKIGKIIPYKKYKPPKKFYDIALVKLKAKVIFTYKIHPACLSTVLTPRYTKTNVTGWGVVDQSVADTMSNELRVATVNLVDHNECFMNVTKFYNRNFKQLMLHQLCAGVVGGGVDTCWGDSGGPLQVRINTEYGNIHRVIGVTSFGKWCGLAETPSIYVSVSKFITWIEKNVWPQYRIDKYEGEGD